MKQKDLKNMVKYGTAADITSYTTEQLEQLRKEGLRVKEVTHGIYGMNGASFVDNNNNSYVITSRNSNLFYLV